ncbi:hypothetical protein FACS1894162_7190 [Bacteroidia bacterium]|nr:hypothetical protein FACS1894162_7190 [Bacteroidia bacterium]
MKMKKVILMMLLLVGAVSVNAQVRIGGTAAADKAILDLNASNTANDAPQGLALPRAAALPSAVPTIDGVLIYSAGDVYVSKAGVWEKLGSGTGGGDTPGGGDTWACGDALMVGSNSYTTALQGDGGCWMTENLRDSVYSDGIKIAYGNAGYQYPDKVESNVATMGLLYTWAAATNNENGNTTDQKGLEHTAVQGVCPAGWHLPSDKEFTTAFATAVPTAWPIAVYPGNVSNGIPYNFGTRAHYWSSSSAASANAWGCYVLSTAPVALAFNNGGRVGQFSVRCKKN